MVQALRSEAAQARASLTLDTSPTFVAKKKKEIVTSSYPSACTLDLDGHLLITLERKLTAMI
ncbi:hypothetical protein MUK42_17646 [Musa troglodytarum]|uniref:Uncharacterized protein n=1 Tax=Musa troglodytarum TaxID=320322 RepID=A0A9E7L6G9_9LILI|nr:hypothetical protein MUK42_17646 [Musa troglodytarum]